MLIQQLNILPSSICQRYVSLGIKLLGRSSLSDIPQRKKLSKNGAVFILRPKGGKKPSHRFIFVKVSKGTACRHLIGVDANLLRTFKFC